MQQAVSKSGFLPQCGVGGQGGPLRQFAPSKLLPLPEIWSENNHITKDICITILPPPLKKIPRRKPEVERFKLAAIFNFVFREGNIPYLLHESNTGLIVL